MGFLAQCEICPQKAILTDQPDGWVCPRCVEATAPAWAPLSQPYVDQVIGVRLQDGTVRTERAHFDPMSGQVVPEATPADLERAQRACAVVLDFAQTISDEFGGFGDVDVAQAEPLPLSIPIDDPLAVAILAEVDRNPHGPLVTTFVNGRVFRLGGYTIAKGAPLSTVWIDEQKLRLASSLPDEAELPYRPPVKDRAYRAPITALADDEPDLGSIRG